MKLELAGIIDKPGTSVPFDYTIDCSDLEVNFVNPFPRPLTVSGEVRNDAGVLTLDAGVEGEMEFDCFRCAEHTVKDYFLDILATVNTELANPDDFDNSDVVLIAEDNTLELDDFIREQIILESDMLFLCDEDCKGVCPTCGKNLNHGPCDCKPEGDHRLDALRELLEKKRGEDNE